MTIRLGKYPRWYPDAGGGGQDRLGEGVRRFEPLARDHRQVLKISRGELGKCYRWEQNQPLRISGDACVSRPRTAG